MSFLGDFETAVTGFLTTVAASGAGIVGIFQGAFVVGFMIWIMVIGYDVAYGRSEEPLGYLMKKVFRIFFIGTFALYAWPQIGNLLIGVKDGLVVGLSGGPNISSILDTALITPMYNFGIALHDWPANNITSFSLFSPLTQVYQIVYWLLMCLAFVVLAAVVVTVCIVALSMFLVALTCFSLLMAVGPFFLLCMAFPFLQRFFETYIGNVLTAALGMAFTAMLVTIVGGLLDINTITASMTATTDYVDFRTFILAFLTKAASGLLLIYMFFKVFNLAASLGGGLNMGNNLVAGMRAIARDARQAAGGRGSQSQTTSNRQGGQQTNAIGQGNRTNQRGSTNNRSSNSANGSSNRLSPMQALARNRTMTGMGINAVGMLGASAARGGVAVGRGAMSLAKRAAARLGN
jgi:type IV secretion system protein VirB6